MRNLPTLRLTSDKYVLDLWGVRCDEEELGHIQERLRLSGAPGEPVETVVVVRGGSSRSPELPF